VREQEAANGLDDDEEDEDKWRYPGQSYERRNSNVTFEVFGGPGNGDHNNTNYDDRKMPPRAVNGSGKYNNADNNDGDESSLEEFQSALQELPEESACTSEVARLPPVREEESNGFPGTPRRCLNRDDSILSNSNAKTPFASNKTSAIRYQVQVPVLLSMSTTTTTEMSSRPESYAVPPRPRDSYRRSEKPAAMESEQKSLNLLLEQSSEDAPFEADPRSPAAMESEQKSPNLLLERSTNEVPFEDPSSPIAMESEQKSPNLMLEQSTDEVPFEEDPMQGVDSETAQDVQAVPATDVPVQEHVQAVSATDVPVQEHVQAVSATDVPVQEHVQAAVSAADVSVQEHVQAAVSVTDVPVQEHVQAAVSAADAPAQQHPTALANNNGHDDRNANVPTDMDIDEESGSPRELGARTDATAAPAASVPSHTSNVEETPASQQHFLKTVFVVGDVVRVQARTWPGINKHGGVGKITRVHTSPDGVSVKYNVKYVMGGGEKNLEEVFVSLESGSLGTKEVDDDDEGVGASGARKSYRLESKEDPIPAALMAHLQAEGFDTLGAQVRGRKRPALANTSRNAKPLNANHSSRRNLPTAEVGQTGSKENAKLATKKAPGKRKPRETIPVAAKENPKTLNNSKTVPSKRKQAPVFEKNVKQHKKRKPTLCATAALELTNEQKCESADALYMDNITAATIQKKVVHVVTSGLSDTDTEALKQLCKATKNNDGTFELPHPGRPK
jgi:hypothetical protein